MPKTKTPNPSAILSDCGKFRYHLRRQVNAEGTGKGSILFVMLNPSTADAENDDPTIIRCINFARDWGYEWLSVANLYAYRATEPAELKAAGYPVGPDNDWYLRTLFRAHPLMVCAWGGNAETARARKVLELAAEEESHAMALKIAKSGAPYHPLYLPADTKLVVYKQGGGA